MSRCSVRREIYISNKFQDGAGPGLPLRNTAQRHTAMSGMPGLELGNVTASRVLSMAVLPFPLHATWSVHSSSYVRTCSSISEFGLIKPLLDTTEEVLRHLANSICLVFMITILICGVREVQRCRVTECGLPLWAFLTYPLYLVPRTCVKPTVTAYSHSHNLFRGHSAHLPYYSIISSSIF